MSRFFAKAAFFLTAGSLLIYSGMKAITMLSPLLNALIIGVKALALFSLVLLVGVAAGALFVAGSFFLINILARWTASKPTVKHPSPTPLYPHTYTQAPFHSIRQQVPQQRFPRPNNNESFANYLHSNSHCWDDSRFESHGHQTFYFPQPAKRLPPLTRFIVDPIDTFMNNKTYQEILNEIAPSNEYDMDERYSMFFDQEVSFEIMQDPIKAITSYPDSTGSKMINTPHYYDQSVFKTLKKCPTNDLDFISHEKDNVLAQKIRAFMREEVRKFLNVANDSKSENTHKKMNLGGRN